MKKNIEALWMGRPISPEVSPEDQAIFSEKFNQLKAAYSALEKRLGSEELVLLNRYLNAQSEVNNLERKSAFVYGFSLAVKLMSEGLNE